MNTTTQSGFTLYELMVTILIVGVVLAMGIPNLRQFTQNSRMAATANDLHSAFHMARSEASRAKQNITICASSNSMTAGADCGGTWDQGFIVFLDIDGNLARSAGTEALLRAHPAAADGITHVVANDATYFMFAATGLGRPDVGGNTAVSQIVFCDERGNANGPGGDSTARLLVATPLGRATILREKTMVTDALASMGKTCP